MTWRSATKRADAVLVDVFSNQSVELHHFLSQLVDNLTFFILLFDLVVCFVLFSNIVQDNVLLGHLRSRQEGSHMEQLFGENQRLQEELEEAHTTIAKQVLLLNPHSSQNTVFSKCWPYNLVCVCVF